MEHVTWTIPTHLKQNVDVRLDLVNPFVKQQQKQQQQQQQLAILEMKQTKPLIL